MRKVRQTIEFANCLAGLKDPITKARLAARLKKAENGLLGDVATVGSGVFEIREHFEPGWRMYYIECEGFLVVMLGGGSKRTQASDIKRAKQIAKEFEG